MDFASILSSEISKKRTAPPASTSSPTKKYQKRSEVEAQRQAEYLQEQSEREAARRAKAEEKQRLADEESARREAVREKQRRLAAEQKRREEERLGISTPVDEGADVGVAEPEMTDAEAVERLRALGEPARLFGETAGSRVKRVKRLEGVRSREHSAARELVENPALEEEEMMLDLQDVKRDPERVYRQLDAWFRLVLREWKRALDERPLAVKESIQGRKAADAMRQADEYMKPLFVHFRNRDLRGQVYEKVCEIVFEAQNRRYVKANDVYLRLSIGNAAWPIGVTMVGIHERSAREKLHENQKEGGAHIMSDEVTRKFLQSIKRCLSFCQTRWPPEDALQLMG